MDKEYWKEFAAKVHKDLNKWFELDGEYPSFNYPAINFTNKDDYHSLWGFLYNEIYQNDKWMLKDLMKKHLEFQNFEKFIGMVSIYNLYALLLYFKLNSLTIWNFITMKYIY